MIRNVKIKKFQVKLAVEAGGKKLIHSNFEMHYVKGVLLRTAWRDAILKLQKEEKLPSESKMETHQTYSLEITPLELIVDLVPSAKEREEAEEQKKAERKAKKKPTKEELAKFREELEQDATLGEEEDDDSDNEEDDDDDADDEND
jgi:hypothetical protein